MLQSINVDINKEDHYPILVGTDIWDEVIQFFSDTYAPRKLFIVIDAKVFDLHGERIKERCGSYFNSCEVIPVPEGEKSKSIPQWQQLQNQLLQKGVERATPLLAVGGGVTGDLAGFAAASVLRGIPLIHMPTSLLAMVDSSIGGKTGVNHKRGKNLVGAFYQPDAVFMDMEFLQTLEQKEWIGGLAEMIKYAAIQIPDMFETLEQAVKQGFYPSEDWQKLILQSAAIKVDIVQQDVHETANRAYLNFGHTFGHALEKLSGYGKLSHGEAVFAGMIAAVHYSRAAGAAIEEVLFSPFKSLYPVNLPGKDRIPDLINAMRYDKKVEDETIRLVLLEKYGQPYLEECNNMVHLENAWKAALDDFNTQKN